MSYDTLEAVVPSATSVPEAAGEAVVGHTPSLARFLQPIVPDLGNPVQLIFLGVAAFFVVRSILSVLSKNENERFSMASVAREATEIPAKRNFTPRELSEFDGKDEETPLYMAVKGIVYDVSKGRSFYGPQGPYANFAGRDASRGLALGSFDRSTLTDLDAPLDDLKDLDKAEMEALNEWAGFFAGKYTPIGKLVPPLAAEELAEAKKDS